MITLIEKIDWAGANPLDEPTFKLLEYQYNLVGGQVTELSYQRGKADQFHYSYLFDADGRLDEAYSSLDGVIWNLDARYLYYLHGPFKPTAGKIAQLTSTR